MASPRCELEFCVRKGNLVVAFVFILNLDPLALKRWSRRLYVPDICEMPYQVRIKSDLQTIL